ncbi:MAG: hypothetical protein H0U95_17475 [Bacteroidetes bacterium]|nr:hypothetical protein [Bacteroidota bacterium]
MKKLFLLFVLVIFVFNCSSQSFSINHVESANKSSFQAITEQGVIKGYFLIFYLDRYTETSNLLSLELYDQNLKQTHSIELVRDKNEQLIDGVFNGEKFCFSFYNLKAKYIDYLILDKQGEISGSYPVNNLTDLEIQYFILLTSTKSDYYSGLLAPIEKKGFIRCGIKANQGDVFGIQKDMRIQLEAFSNDGELLWKKTTGIEGKKIWESTNYLFSNEKYIVTSITYRNGIMSKNFKNYLMFLDATTGNELFRMEANVKNNYFSYNGINYDENLGELFCYGEYYDKEAGVKNKSIGLFIKIIDAATGSIKQEKYISFEKDIKSLIEKKSNVGKIADRNMAIHKILRAEDGRIFAITEQFANNDSTKTLFLYDLITFEFSKELVLIDAQIVNKITDTHTKSEFNTNVTASINKFTNGFDYCLTSINSNKNFTCIYKTTEKNKSYLGSFTYKNKSFNYDKILRTENPIIYTVLPGKVGYIAIYEYYDLEKRIRLRIEKLNI